MVQGVCYLPSSKTSLAGVRNCNTPFSLYPFILCGSWVLLSLAAPNQSIACELCAPTDDDRKKRCGRRKKEKCKSFGATEPKDLCTHTQHEPTITILLYSIGTFSFKFSYKQCIVCPSSICYIKAWSKECTTTTVVHYSPPNFPRNHSPISR